MMQAQNDSVLEVKKTEEDITTAVANARLAEDGGDLLAYRQSIKALDEAVKANQALVTKLFEQQATARAAMMAAALPSAEENTLNTQLTDLAKLINDKRIIV